MEKKEIKIKQKISARNAIKKGDIIQLERILQRIDPNKLDKHGETLLLNISHSKNINIEIIRTILQNGGDPNVKNNAGKTALHFLCQNEASYFDIIKLMIEYGADPHFKDYYGFTPFDRLKKNKGNSKHLEELSSIKPFRRQYDKEMKKPWKLEKDPYGITNMFDAKKNIIWRGELKNGKQWKGYGIYEIEGDNQLWIYEGILNEANFDGEGKLTTYHKILNEDHEIKRVTANTKLKYNKATKKSEGKLFEEGKEYFIEFNEGKEVYDSKKRTFEGLRLMLIGNVNVGKTSLRRRLLALSNHEENKRIHKQVSNEDEPPTQGVQIMRWEDNREKTLFSLWDFSGHEEYHVVHSFFFSSGSVYLLLFDCSLPLHKIVAESKFVYWFHFLQTQAGRDASVIMVATKIDILQKEFWFYEKDIKTKERLTSINLEIEKVIRENDFQLKFHNFTYGDPKKPHDEVSLLFYPINTKELNQEKSGLLNISCLLSNVYQNVSHNVCTTLKHKIVFELIENIAGKKKEDFLNLNGNDQKPNEETPFISVSLLREELEKTKQDDVEAAEALKNIDSVLVDLNNLGVIVYSDNPSLRDTIIVNPQWFNNVFTFILDNGKKRLQNVFTKMLDDLNKLSNQGKLYEISNERNSKVVAEEIVIWIKGDANPNLTIEEIWANQNEKSKSRVDKISFQELSDRVHSLQLQMKKEGVFQHMSSFHNQKHKDVLQTFFSVDETKIIPVISDILGLKYKNDQEKRDYLFSILKKLEFFLPKGRHSLDKNSNKYLVPLLFPKTKPHDLILSNGADFRDVKRTNEWVIRYGIPFKPPSLWKILFLKLRRQCVGLEEKVAMIDEIYWFGGFVFNFNRITSDKKSVLVQLELTENEKTSNTHFKKPTPTKSNLKGKKEPQELSYTIKVVIKSEEEPIVVFHSLDNVISNFMKKWNIPPVREIIRKYIDPGNVTSKAPPICSVCSVQVAINDKLKLCENCTSKSFLSQQFLLLNTVANTPYGRVFKASHKSTGTLVAIKERTIESESSYKYTQKEIKRFKIIEKKLPTLTTNRLICVLDDSLRKIKSRYVVSEWIQGGSLVGFKSACLQQSSFKTERDFIRLILILLNELKKLHSAHLVHGDIKTENIMWTERDGKVYFLLIGFGSLEIDSGSRIQKQPVHFDTKESDDLLKLGNLKLDKSDSKKKLKFDHKLLIRPKKPSDSSPLSQTKENEKDDKDDKENIQRNSLSNNISLSKTNILLDESITITPLLPRDNLTLSSTIINKKVDPSTSNTSTSPPLTPLTKVRKAYSDDVYDLGMAFKDILVSTKIKVTENVLGMINLMVSENPDKRPTTEECINQLIIVCEKFNYNHMDIYLALSKSSEFIIPRLCDIEKLRQKIFINNPKNDKGETPLIKNKEEINNINNEAYLDKSSIASNIVNQSVKSFDTVDNSVVNMKNVLDTSLILEEKDRLVVMLQDSISAKNNLLDEKDRIIEQLRKQIDQFKNNPPSNDDVKIQSDKSNSNHSQDNNTNVNNVDQIVSDIPVNLDQNINVDANVDKSNDNK